MAFFHEHPELLSAFRRGERSVLEQVYRAYLKRVEAVVRFGVHQMQRGSFVAGVRPSDVVDVVQETFVRAFSEKVRHAYDASRLYAPYITTIARNLVLAEARRRGREISTADFPELGDVPDVELPWSEPGRVRAAEAYLATLPDELRGVHEQRYIHGKSQEDAAQSLGISRQQLRTREARLRQGLSEHLANQNDREPLEKIGGRS